MHNQEKIKIASNVQYFTNFFRVVKKLGEGSEGFDARDPAIVKYVLYAMRL